MGRATTWGRAATAGVVLMVLLALAGCGSQGGSAGHSAADATTAQTTTTTTASVEGPQPITAAEQQWLLAVTRYHRRLNLAVGNLNLITESSLRRTATVFDGCRAALHGAGASGRFQPAAAFAKRACRSLHKAAALLRRTKGYDDSSLCRSTPPTWNGSRESAAIQPRDQQCLRQAGNAGELLAKAIVKAQRIKQTFGDLDGAECIEPLLKFAVRGVRWA